MDERQFDDLTRAFARGTSRRRLLAGLTAAIAGGLAGLSGRGADAGLIRGQALGAACARATECASFRCVDGVCCDTACTGQCEACNLPGQAGACSPVAGAPVGARPACPGSGACATTCDGQTTSHCAGAPGPDVSCGQPICVDGWATAYACNGNGMCVPTTTNCAPFGCDTTGTACYAGCTSHEDCGPGATCIGSDCVPIQPLGATCTDHGQYANGLCADNVCCIGDCGPCRVCNAAGNAGFCAPAPDDDPCDGGRCCEGGCVNVSTDVEHCGGCDRSCLGAANGRAVCTDGSCAVECLPGFQRCTEDGPCVSCCTENDCPASTAPCEGAAVCTDGVCSFQPADDGTPCREATCTEGTETLAATCTGGSTACPPGETLFCGLYTCNETGTACHTTCENDGDVGCVAGAHCDDEQCLTDSPLQTPCDEPSDCESGFCVDGVCCNTACTEQCADCNRADLGLAGVCLATAAGSAPRGDREPCAGAGTACEGACDGTLRTSCAYPDETTLCQGATCQGDSSAEGERFCDGAGACPHSTEFQICLRFACRAGACLTSCNANDDCQSNYFCDDGDCLLRGFPGAACGDGDECQSGHCVDGVCCTEASCDGQCQRCDVPGEEGSCAVAVGHSCVSDNKCLRETFCDIGGNCTGTSSSCSLPCAHFSLCNSATGECEPVEAFGFKPAGTVCGEPTLLCELPPACDGVSHECPAQGEPKPMGGVFDICRPRPCEISFCNGTDLDCPPTGVPMPTGTECGVASGGCETTQTCDGESFECPPPRLLPSTHVCRPRVSLCDIEEACTGNSPDCPPDEIEPTQRQCGGGVCHTRTFCDGVTGGCPTPVRLEDNTRCGPEESGQICCEGRCWIESEQNCGACGRACVPSCETCVDGTCVITDPDDPACGGCDNACDSCQNCLSGTCQDFANREGASCGQYIGGDAGSCCPGLDCDQFIPGVTIGTCDRTCSEESESCGGTDECCDDLECHFISVFVGSLCEPA